MKWDNEEGHLALEAEILEFMKDSKNPDAFQSKKELLEVGMMDLSDEDEKEQENGKISLRSAIETQ